MTCWEMEETGKALRNPLNSLNMSMLIMILVVCLDKCSIFGVFEFASQDSGAGNLDSEARETEPPNLHFEF